MQESRSSGASGNNRIRTSRAIRAARRNPISQTNRRTKRRRRINKRGLMRGAQSSLRKFRQATILAVAFTGLLLLLFFPGGAEDAQAQNGQELPDTMAIIEEIPTQDLIRAEQEDIEEDRPVVESPEDIGRVATQEAIRTFRNLWIGFYTNLPNFIVAFLVLLLAWLLVKGFRYLIKKVAGNWERSEGLSTVTAIAIWLFAIGVALSVVAGDIRALVGSLGLIGLALSWALQTPIESFTGWLLNSFQQYYKKGDRIMVGEVFGDVYKIDFLTTTVWEIGAPYRTGFVQAEQPTGRLVTFPNNEILAGTIVNLTKDFPYVWDELAFQIANESDLDYSINTFQKVAEDLIGNYMQIPAMQYEEVLRKAGIDMKIPSRPQSFIHLSDSWTEIVIRYLVGAKERRVWKSELSLRLQKEIHKPEHAEKIGHVYQRQQIQMFNGDILKNS
jgi:small-conductance mechanosensitive channel